MFHFYDFYIESTAETTTEHNVCKECCEIFTAVSALKRHSKSQHSSEKPEFSCPKCEKTFSRMHDLGRHCKQLHGEKSTETAKANTSGWVILDQENSDDSLFSSDVDLSPEADNSSCSITPYDQSRPNEASLSSDNTSVNLRKRKAEIEVASFSNAWEDALASSTGNGQSLAVEMQTWLVTLGMTLAKMSPIHQAELKMMISNIVGKKELEVLKKMQEKTFQ